MQRLATALILCGSICAATGCSHLVETRTIEAFAKSLEEADMAALRERSSPEFKEKVLRRDDALEAMKIINLPEGELEVVDVKEGENEKTVTVEVGEKKRKLLYTLARDEKSGKWVVDDIKLKKKLKPGQENKTVAEQMDLLLSLREFLDAWENGARDGVLAVTTPSLGQLLGELPPGCLLKITKQVAGDMGKQSGLRPVVEGHAQTALVRLTRKSGDLLITLKAVDGKWKADDIHLQSKRDGEHVPSVRKLAVATIAAVGFYEAYQQADKPALAKICTPTLFDNCLKPADLSTVKLPQAKLHEGEFEIKMVASRALCIVKDTREWVELSLLSQPDDPANPDSSTKYLIDEVSFHELDGSQERRLSALLTAQSVMQVFSEALVARDLKTIQFLSTHDFNQRVWTQLDAPMLATLPLDKIEAAAPQLVDIDFKGAVTKVTVSQGATPLTYVLRDQGGKLLVDDVLFPALDRPGELKLTLELLLPIHRFTAGWQSGQIKELQQASSRDFNRIIWNQLSAIPALPESPTAHLNAPLGKVQQAPDRAIVALGDERWGAKIFLNKEGERYVVDDVLLISGVEKEPIGLKQRVRTQLAYGTSTADAGIQPPTAVPPAQPAPGTSRRTGVVPASASFLSPPGHSAMQETHPR